MLRRLSTRLSSLFRRARYERELDRELAFHLDMLTEQHVRAGMPPDEARRAAAPARFGAVDRVKDDVRDTWLSRMLETLAQDVRYGSRSLRRNPGFALVVDRDDGARHRRQHRHLQRRQRRAAASRCPTRTATGSSCCTSSSRSPASTTCGFSYQEIARLPLGAQPRRRRRVPRACGSSCSASPSRSASRTGVVSANFFDVLGVQAALRPRVRRRRRRAGRAGGAGAQLQVLAARVRRRPVGRRPHLPDERPAAPGRRHPAAGAAVSGRSRRLHADVRLPVPLGTADTIALARLRA